MSDSKKTNPHAGHRERMRARLKQEGTDHFESHQLLEMYLFPLLPRRDTNEIAHRLLNRFGSLQDIFLASHEDLIQVEGISDITATTNDTCFQSGVVYTDNLQHRFTVRVGTIGNTQASALLVSTFRCAFSPLSVK
jgi:DNA repair protein RadC